MRDLMDFSDIPRGQWVVTDNQIKNMIFKSIKELKLDDKVCFDEISSTQSWAVKIFNEDFFT